MVAFRVAMPESSVLSIKPRTELRKQNHALRAQGAIPGVIYGHRVDPVSVSVPRREFDRAFHKAGRTQLLDLQIDGEGKPRKVLVRQVQYNPRSGQPLHVDFYQVNLKEKIAAEVPIVLVGESPAVQRRDGELQQNLHSLKVNCLPADIPEHIEVDVSGLENVDDSIRISELTIPAEVEVTSDPDDVVVKVAAPRVAEEEPVAEGEAAEGEAAEGEAGAQPEGEAGAGGSSEES
ncbi:MAG: large subunit ribosomal protein [Chloroflexota bacterium]|jgi:large subunit ribosomal protein L25|nr:large subunit ribosomal protein [Chloroflexota bacterium]